MRRSSTNSPGMIDVTSKKKTRRIARARCTVALSPDAFKKLCQHQSPKGDVLACARVAGVMAAKNTPGLIPLCHPLFLSQVAVDFTIKAKSHTVIVDTQVMCQGPTGVEMEALTAAAVAALTIYDMMKWADRAIVISDLKLVYKSGGKSGVFDLDKKTKTRALTRQS